MKFWDAAGEKRYKPVISTYFKSTDCAILMFDVTNLASFQQLPQHIQEFRKVVNCPMFVVGNKIKEPNKQVTEQMVAELCESIGKNCFHTFVDVKHNDDQNVEACVNLILALLLDGQVPNHRSVKSARTGE